MIFKKILTRNHLLHVTILFNLNWGHNLLSQKNLITKRELIFLSLPKLQINILDKEI